MIGTTLGPYRIDRELGAGGMGKVYAATVAGRCPGLAEGTRVALKVVHPHLLDTPGFFKRFLREGEIGKAVVHENVVRTYDCDAVRAHGEDHHFLVMEYVEGQTLRDLLAELERVPEELCRHIGREVAKGLAAIHAEGVVHRDIKPENVLITADHVVKVMDLGVARLNDEALRLSQTGAFVGSIHYAAPEQFRAPAPRSREGAAQSAEGVDAVDGRADLHALGLVLYELACGVNPYFADTIPEVLKKVLHEDPRRLGDVNPQLSPFFEEVVHTLLAKRPDERFVDAAALLAVLDDGEKSAWWMSRSKAIRAETHRPLRRIRIPRETAVYGRENELSKLRGLFEKAKTGEGQVVLIDGEAGIGKSRVVDELIGRLQRDGEDLNFLFGSYPPGGAATAAGAFSTAFREQFGADGSSAYLKPSQVLVPAFDALLRGEPTPTGTEPLTKDSLQTCFVHATRGLAAERVTVLLIDDLHFATEDARSLFTSLAMAVPGNRILLVGTTRPGIDEKWLAGLTRLPQTMQMALHRLGPKDLAQLLADSLKSESLATQLGHQIAVKSDGNPFFVFEIIRGLRDGQFLTQQDDGTWVTTRVIGDIKIPSSVLDLVNARVADLSDDERALLDVAACWGYEFDPGLVGDVLGLARIPTLRAFGQIERQHRLVRAAGRTMVFDHHQVQEALYGRMLEQLREEYHAALATALETRTKASEKDPGTLDGALCVDLCEHYLKGARGESALRYLPAAQAHLSKGYLHAQTIALGERALAAPGLLTGAERAKALLRQANALEAMGRKAAQRRAIDEAVALADAAGGAELRAGAHRLLGHYLERDFESEAATVELEHARTLAREAGSREIESAAAHCLCGVLTYERRFGDAEAAVRQCIALRRETGDRGGEAAATMNLGVVFYAQGRFSDAREHYERSLALSREIGDRKREADATMNVGNAYFSQGRFAEAQEHHERSLALFREIGDRQGECGAICWSGNILHSQGRLPEALDRQEQYLALSREIGHREGEAFALHNLGAVSRERGDAGASEERFLACLRLCEEIGHRHAGAATQRALGSLRAAASGGTSGREELVAARDAAKAIGAPGVEVLSRCELALLPGGDPADALASYAAHEARLDAEERREARLLLFKATADPAHLVEAKRLLDEALAQAPQVHRDSMCRNLRVNREIIAACKEQGIE